MASQESRQRMKTTKGLYVPFTVTLAEKRFRLEELLGLRAGKVLEFDTPHDAPLTFVVDDSPLGRGRAVDLGEHLGFLVESVEAAPSRPAGNGPGLS